MTGPSGGWPPPPGHKGAVVLEPLRAALLELDTAAYAASPRAIDAHSAGRWPTEGFTAEENSRLIAQHEEEHSAGEAFAYSILDAGRTRELGCAYLRPLDDFLERSGTLLTGVAPDSAITTFWVIDDASARPDVTTVLGDVLTWAGAWGAAPLVLRTLPDEQGTLAAATELGLSEVTAERQELPYRVVPTCFDVAVTPTEAVRGLWQTLSERDYDGIADWVTDDCIYMDVPLGPEFAARGPADIAKRLRVGWGDLAAYENHDGLLVAEGDAVMYEHSETWTFASGEIVVLPFATVHRVRDGRVCLWKDYWDYNAIMTAAPSAWVDSLATADTGWLFDASGLV